MAEYLLKLPNLGEDAGASATVSLWHKREGDDVRADQDLLEVTYDKATFYVPSPVDGKLARIVAQEETEVPVGGTLAVIEHESKE